MGWRSRASIDGGIRRTARSLSSDGLAGFAFVVPNLIGFLTFVLLPVLASLALSFAHWDLLSEPRYAGFGNFRRLLTADPEFWRYWGNTLFLMLGIPFVILGSLFLAVLLNRKMRGVVVFRTLYFLPTISAGVAVYILWRWMFNADFGLINTWLGYFGISGPAWLQSTEWAKPALVIMSVWAAIGGTDMVLYLAALQGVSPELYEAAQIDGASRWHQFWRITWPLVTPTTFFILIMSIIQGFQGGFEAAFVMTNGGPAGATTTVSLYIYRLAYEWYQMGYAACVAWTMFVVVFTVTVLNWKYGGRLVHY